jgi:hypothetical protein
MGMEVLPPYRKDARNKYEERRKDIFLQNIDILVAIVAVKRSLPRR